MGKPVSVQDGSTSHGGAEEHAGCTFTYERSGRNTIGVLITTVSSIAATIASITHTHTHNDANT